ncbi:GspE/PulE family protein [Paracraurococcus lichenis]|uniref:ATPase, T2SS/T4P/T4SS family n=1 Tax=Paracraurococcus lichenis TaxID=3064888 RepID=A0ABT9E836_9PROT|nr:ATPase, T2SS/T4P/T4SS family [Paracraurococcus sp. LOR1-02]MDO9712287.1 ATPase, T2SS/T4P/T4SS family [Paracraurococcus sp. LOR1-02]
MLIERQPRNATPGPVTPAPEAPLARALDDLAALLVEQGQCDARAVDRGRRVAAETGQRLDAVLMHLGLVTERGLAQAHAALLGLRIAEAARWPAEPLLPERLQPRFLRQARALPVAREGDTLVLAVADPLDAFTPAAIAAATGLAVRLEVALPIELEAALERLYPTLEPEEAGTPATAEPLEEDAERLRDLASEAPVIRLVNQMISRAVETGASDIHIEPFEDRLRIRCRYDGVLQTVDTQPARLTPAIISRIKIMARLDIAERRLPQDGRIRLAVRGQEVDFRVSTIPSLHAETVVLRVLDQSAVEFDYAQLGLPPRVVQRLTASLALPNGIVLVTGPVGSGKTTTLYTALLGLNAETRKIITIEDPIEYRLPGITQVQVKPQIGLSFASLLRNIVRQDPNVVMVGEIRDLETAETAVTAALAGRLVLSTLHTNSAAASIPRLRDMGLEDYLIASVLRGVLAQRLVRKLCPACKREAEAPPALVAEFALDRRPGWRGPRLWQPVGCAACRNTGFRGRLAIAEFLAVDAQVERLVFARAEHGEIERAGVAGGMVTMLDCGLDAAIEGITTVDEVLLSVRAEA